MGRLTTDATSTDRELVTVLKALADPTRFRMVQEIAAAGELSCGQVAELFDVSQPTISHHLKILIQSGLLMQRTHGKHHYTSVDRALLSRVLTLLPSRLVSPAAKRASRPRAATRSRVR
jgi:DNA-binding transcriptional ArsR family regulator